MKMKSFSLGGLILALLLVCAPMISAVPVFDTFGAQPTFDFGGTGIDNNSVAAATTYIGSTGSVKFGMTATPRFDNPAVWNDGAGTFTAQAGGDTAHGQPGYALWNFDFDSEITGNMSGYTLSLWYDMQSIGPIPLAYGDSWNLGMVFLGVPGFDPTLSGMHNFSLELTNAMGRVVDTVAIDVNVVDGGSPNSVPDGGVTLALLGLASVVVVGLKRFTG